MTYQKNSTRRGVFKVATIAAAAAAVTIDPASANARSLVDEFRSAHAAHRAALAEFDRVVMVPQELRTSSSQVMGFDVAEPERDASGAPRGHALWVVDAASLVAAAEYLDDRPLLRGLFQTLAPIAQEYEHRAGLARHAVAAAAVRLAEAERQILESKARA